MSDVVSRPERKIGAGRTRIAESFLGKSGGRDLRVAGLGREAGQFAKVCGARQGKLRTFTKARGRLARAVNGARYNPIYNLNRNPPNPIIKSHFHATCVRHGASRERIIGRHGRNISPR